MTRAGVHLSPSGPLLTLYQEHEGPLALPTLSRLLDAAMREALASAGVDAPPTPAPSPQTAAATRARVQRRRERRADRGA